MSTQRKGTGRCATCAFWDTAGAESVGSVGYGDCKKSAIGFDRAYAPGMTGMMIGSAEADTIITGAGFGCIHYEKKEPQA